MNNANIYYIILIFCLIFLIIGLIYFIMKSYKNIGTGRSIGVFLYIIIFFTQLTYYKEGAFTQKLFNAEFDILLNLTILNIIISIFLFLSRKNMPNEDFKFFTIIMVIAQSAFSMMMSTKTYNDPMDNLLYALAYIALPIFVGSDLGNSNKLERNMTRIEDRIKNIEKILENSSINTKQKNRCVIKLPNIFR